MVKSSFDVVYATDRKYHRYTSASIHSLLDSQPDGLIRRIFVMCALGEMPEIRRRMKRQLGLWRKSRVQWVGVDEAYKSLPIMKGSWWSNAAFLRFFAAEALPPDTENLLYLDSDVLIRGPLDELKKIFGSMRSKGVIVAARPHPDRGDWRRTRRKFGLDSYFNSGVLAIDAQAWREKKLAAQLVTYYVENQKRLKFSDQDTLNVFFADQYFQLSYKFNNFPTVDDEEGAIIVHLIGPIKPTLKRARNRFSKEFQRYIRRTHPFTFLVGLEVNSLFRTLLLTDLPPRLPRSLRGRRQSGSLVEG